MSVSAFHFRCSRVSALASRKQQPKQPSAEARAASARLSVQQQLNRALADLNGALESARVISREIMPRAGVVVTNAEARYKLGDASRMFCKSAVIGTLRKPATCTASGKCMTRACAHNDAATDRPGR